MIDQFLKYLLVEKRYSTHTHEAYKRDLGQFLTFLKAIYPGTTLSSVQHFHIRAWQVDLVTNKVTPRSINRKLSSLRSFYKFGIRKGYFKSNPLLKIIPPKTPKKLPATIPDNKLEPLLDNESQHNKLSFSFLRDYLIIELLYGTGMRRQELIDLQTDSIDRSYQQIKIIGKGNKQRIVPITQQLIDSIDLYLEVLRDHFAQEELTTDGDYLILTDKGKRIYPKLVYNVVKRYLSTVTTAKKKSPHVLRHSFATHLMDNGADLNAVKELLGHSSLSATQIYTHNSIEKLKEVYKKSHPKAKK